MSIGGHHSPKMGKDEWLTPPDLLAKLGPFHLDPCAPVVSPWKIADTQISLPDDGLKAEWSGMVWCNPPYGQQTGAWLNRMAKHGNGIALVFARTETAMFCEYVWRAASTLLFIAGRLHFHHVDGRRADANSGAPSVLVAYGLEASIRLAKSGIPGRLVFLGHTRESAPCL